MDSDVRVVSQAAMQSLRFKYFKTRIFDSNHGLVVGTCERPRPRRSDVTMRSIVSFSHQNFRNIHFLFSEGGLKGPHDGWIEIRA
jgi:hypothetical protein